LLADKQKRRCNFLSNVRKFSITDLPGESILVSKPAIFLTPIVTLVGHQYAAAVDESVPDAIGFLNGFAYHIKGDTRIEFEQGSAIYSKEFFTGEFEFDCHYGAFRLTVNFKSFFTISRHMCDLRVGEYGSVKLCGFFRFLVEPKAV